MQKKNLLSFFSLSACLFFSLFGCQSSSPLKQDKLSVSKEAIHAWTGDLLVEKGKKKYSLNLYMQAIKNKKLRIDIMTKWNMGLLSFVLTEKDIKYLLNQKKEYHYGKWEKKRKTPLLVLPMFPLDPHLLHAVLFDQAIKEKPWKCEDTKDKKTKEMHQKLVFAISCKNSEKNLSLNWQTLSSLQEKRISFSFFEEKEVLLHIKLKFLFERKKSSFSSNKNPFDLIPPKNFKKRKIPSTKGP